MPYKYTAYDANDNIIKGTLDATDIGQAEEALANAGYTVINVKKTRGRIKLEEAFPSLYGIKPDDVITFSRQLATLLEAGLTLPQSLQLLEMQVERAAFKNVIAGLKTELEGGSSFSVALGKYSNAFPEIYQHMISAGEQSGDMANSLRQAVEYLERGQMAIKKAKRALVYPSFIIVIGIIVVLVLVTFVLPPLLDMFEQMGAELPATTRVLKALTDTFGDYPLPILGGFVGLIIGIVVFFRTPRGKDVQDRLLLKMPLIGGIVIQSNMALFSRTSATLLAAGVALPRIMDIVTSTAPNNVIKAALKEVQEGLVQGHGMSKPMALSGLFPPLLVQMITVGEQTGTLDSSLETVASFYESEVTNKLDSLTSLIEPVVIAGIALVVGFIAISVISPMYSILGTVGGE